MLTYRLCEEKDYAIWQKMNWDFMAEEIRDEELWNSTNQSSDEEFRQVFFDGLNSKDKISLLLFEDEGRVVGFANLIYIFSIWAKGKALILDDLFISPEYRGKGYGRRSVELIEQHAKDCGCKRIQFQSETTNPNAMSFYIAIGFTPSDMRFYVKYF